MSYEAFIRRVSERGPFDDEAAAARSVESTLRVLAERLSHDRSSWLRSKLPAELGAWLDNEFDRELSLAAFYERVATREGVEVGRALEHAHVVLRTLGEELTPADLDTLERDLPEDFAALLAHRKPTVPPSPPLHAHAGNTLAAGRPRSAVPISEAPGDAHSHSVDEPNPHGDTKLSSAQQGHFDEEHETLAEGRPGSEHPVSETD